MNTKSDTGLVVFGCVGLTVIAVLVTILSSILNGWVLSVMWGWFVVPLFDLPKLSIATAIGISMIASMLTHQATQDSKKDKDKTWSDVIGKAVGTIVFAPLLTLFIGWIVHLFL